MFRIVIVILIYHRHKPIDLGSSKLKYVRGGGQHAVANVSIVSVELGA
jgi:hypothetical protein